MIRSISCDVSARTGWCGLQEFKPGSAMQEAPGGLAKLIFVGIPKPGVKRFACGVGFWLSGCANACIANVVRPAPPTKRMIEAERCRNPMSGLLVAARMSARDGVLCTRKSQRPHVRCLANALMCRLVIIGGVGCQRARYCGTVR